MQPHRRQPTRLPCPWDSPGKNTGVGCHSLLQCMKVKVKLLSRVRLCATPWTAAYQAPPSMGFSRQECWSGVPLPSLLPFILRFLLCLSPLHDLSYQYSDSPGSGSSPNPSWTFSPSFSQLQETTSEPALSSLPLTLTSCKKHPAFL